MGIKKSSMYRHFFFFVDVFITGINLFNDTHIFHDMFLGA